MYATVSWSWIEVYEKTCEFTVFAFPLNKRMTSSPRSISRTRTRESKK
jgi:hypothetical protein